MIFAIIFIGYIISVLFSRQCIIKLGDEFDRQPMFALVPVTNVVVGLVLLCVWLGNKIRINSWFWVEK